MRFTAMVFLSALLIVTGFTSLAHAGPVTLNFTGSVTKVDDPFGIGGALVQPGDPVFVSLQYDTATSDIIDDPTDGRYIGPGWFKLLVDGLRFEQTAGLELDVLDGFAPAGPESTHDGLQGLICCGSVGTFGPPTKWPNVLPLLDTYLFLLILSQTTPPFDLFSSDALPTTVDMSKLDYTYGEIGTDSGAVGYRFTYDITAVTAPVPEPPTLALLSIGTVLLVLMHRVRRSRLPR